MSGNPGAFPRTICATALGMALVAPLTAASAQSASLAPRIAVADMLTIEAEGLVAGQSGDEAEQIGAVAIRGNQAIDDARYQAVVEGFFGEPLTEEVLDRLTDELAQLAREDGYEYAQATIDDGAVDSGMIAISIDEGIVEAVAIEGSEHAMARRMLEDLVGRPLRKQELESVLLRVSDIPSLSLRGARLKREGGIRTLAVKLERQRASARIAADNYGTESFGPIRLVGSARVNSLLTSTDELRTSIRINPIEPDELLFLSGSYQTQLGQGGTTMRISGSVGRTAPGGELDGSDISGDTVRLSTQFTAPLKRSRKSSIWLDAEAAYIQIQQDDLGSLLRDDTVVTAAIGLRTRFALAGGGFVRTGSSIERGLGILGATRLGDPNASRSDGDGVFTKFRFNADSRIPIAERFDAYLSLAGQIADRPLLASEELGLGGPYRVRGYNFAEVLGDEGVYGLAELRYRVNTSAVPLDYLQLYGFVDGGYVSDIDQTFGEGSLFSAGPGFRGRLGAIDFEVESAFPLGGSGERSDSDSPQINVRAGVNF